MSLSRSFTSVAVAALLLAGGRPAQALTITPYFADSLASAANAAQVETDIGIAISRMENLISTPGSVSIIFTESDSGAYLGATQTGYYYMSYGAYVGALEANAAENPGNTILATALANLASDNDANGSKYVLLSSAATRLALGTTATPCFDASGAFVSGCNQTYDGIITLGNAVPLNYGTAPVAGQYSEISTIEHEMDEVLGIGGPGSVLNEFNATVPGYSFTYGDAFVGPLDLYRCAAGAPSLTTSSSVTAYFSIDGCQTSLIGFNQNSSGDYGDWSTQSDVQSAFSAPGNSGDLNASSPEIIALQAIGYSANAPEPASLALLATGSAALAAVRRRRASHGQPLNQAGIHPTASIRDGAAHGSARPSPLTRMPPGRTPSYDW